MSMQIERIPEKAQSWGEVIPLSRNESDTEPLAYPVSIGLPVAHDQFTLHGFFIPSASEYQHGQVKLVIPLAPYQKPSVHDVYKIGYNGMTAFNQAALTLTDTDAIEIQARNRLGFTPENLQPFELGRSFIATWGGRPTIGGNLQLSISASALTRSERLLFFKRAPFLPDFRSQLFAQALSEEFGWEIAPLKYRVQVSTV